MGLVGRRYELTEVARLLDRAAAGTGGLLVVSGAPGSGRTALADAAVQEALGRGFDVVRAAATAIEPGRRVWAPVLRDAGLRRTSSRRWRANPVPSTSRPPPGSSPGRANG